MLPEEKTDLSTTVVGSDDRGGESVGLCRFETIALLLYAGQSGLWVVLEVREFLNFDERQIVGVTAHAVS